MLNFIYNPTAGKGKAQRFRVSIEEKLKEAGVAYSFWETTQTHDATRIANMLTQKGEKDIIAMGGDGTVNEVLNGFVDTDGIRLGIVPCGSGNDFAAVAGIPATPQGALDVLLKCEPKPTDYLECSGVRGLNIIGAGIDVEILKRCYKARFLKGSLNYFVSLVLCLLQFEFYRFKAMFNSESKDHNALIVCACNGRRFGGGLCICPEADCDDGMLDVVMVEDVTKSMIPRALIKLMQGKILEQKFTRHERTKHLTVQFEKPATIQVDGELHEGLPFDVQVVSNKLLMYRK